MVANKTSKPIDGKKNLQIQGDTYIFKWEIVLLYFIITGRSF